MYVKWKNCALTGSPVCPLPLREMSALLPLQAIILKTAVEPRMDTDLSLRKEALIFPLRTFTWVLE